MTRFSVQARDGIFIKGYGFLSFAESMGRNIRKIIRIKYSQKLFDHAKQSAIDALKTSYKKKVIQKKVEATGDFVGNKITDKITRVSKNSPQHNLEKNEQILREEYIYIYIYI